MRFIYLFLIFLFSLSPYIWCVSKSGINAQVGMVGARHAALGYTNPSIPGDTNGLFINPATLGSIESMPLSVSYKKLLNEFQYSMVNVGIPVHLKLKLRRNNERLQRLMFGFSYGSYALSGIPENTDIGSNHNGVHDPNYQTVDSYSEGTQIGSLSMGTSFYDFFGFNTLAFGLSSNYTRRYITGSSGSSGSSISFNSGVIGSRYLNWLMFNKIHFGFSIHNIVASPIKRSPENKETLPLSIYSGVKVDMVDEMLSLYAHNGLDGVVLGSEYTLDNSIILRGSSDFKTFSLGAGIIFDQIATGFTSRDYSFRFDYTYSHYKFPITEPSHMFSISILGTSQPEAPRILFPQQDTLITNKSTIDLSGIGPKHTTMRIFNNDEMVRTTATNKLGKWNYKKLSLTPNKNLIHVQSYSLNKDLSLQSYPIMVYSDTQPPQFNIHVIPNKEVTKFILDINENVSEIDAFFNNQPLSFKQVERPVVSDDIIDAYIQPTQWIAEISTPPELKPNNPVKNEMLLLSLQLSDLAGNKTSPKEFPVFLKILFPQDKYVHYHDTLRIIGQASPMVGTLKIEHSPIYLDTTKQFSAPIDLALGKNIINFEITLTPSKEIETDAMPLTVLNYTMRILHLKRYPDVTPKTKGRREIEFLSTLDILSGHDDGNFYPNDPVTRGYITKLMVLASKATVSESVNDFLFSDVPISHEYALYIKSAIENGLIFAFPDGSFRPDQALTLSESIFLLSNADLIEFTEVDSNEYITRAQLAEFLAYSPEYEQKIEELINWEIGYD
jgi:hypothetical protein